MKKLLVKYWKGWLTPENMKDPCFQPLWKQEAEKAEDEGKELIVFKLPKNSGAVESIERFLQEKFG